MILGPVSYLDCLVFCIFLAPQLILQAGIFETVKVILQVLPFLGQILRPPPPPPLPMLAQLSSPSIYTVLKLPASFLYERFVLAPADRSAFVRQASPFEDVVVRCVRYAFANISPKVGRVFFGKNVALPWMRWRMLRHGYLKSPVHWREYQGVSDFQLPICF